MKQQTQPHIVLATKDAHCAGCYRSAGALTAAATKHGNVRMPPNDKYTQTNCTQRQYGAACPGARKATAYLNSSM
jgi:hypothetical protein